MADFIKNNPLTNFSKGFFYPFRAGRFILKHPRLYKFVIIPFLINALVFTLAVYFGLDFFNETVVGLIPQGEAWYWLTLYYVLWVVAVLATAVLVFFTFTVVGNLIASPFNDLLSERTEESLVGQKHEEPFSMRAFLIDARRTLWEESKKMLAFLLCMGLLLLLNFIPGIGSLIYSCLAILLTLFFLSVEYTGYVFGRKRGTFKDQRRFISSRKFLMLGFSTGILAILAIPFLQFLCIPVGVVGATQIWFDVEHQGQTLSPSSGSKDGQIEA